MLICLVMASVNIFNDAQNCPLPQGNLPAAGLDFLAGHRRSPPRRGRFRRSGKTARCCRCWPSRCPRPQLIFGKFLGCWLACGLTLLCFYVFFGALAASREHHWPLLDYFQAATCTGSCSESWWPWPCSARWCLPRRRPTPPSALWWSAAFCLLGRHLDQVALQLARTDARHYAGDLLCHSAPGIFRHARPGHPRLAADCVEVFTAWRCFMRWLTSAFFSPAPVWFSAAKR